MEDQTENSSNLIVGIMFIALFLGILILAVITITNALGSAYTVDVTRNITNQSGWLNTTGFTLNGTDISNLIAIKTSDGEVLTPGNYTIQNGVIFNDTIITC